MDGFPGLDRSGAMRMGMVQSEEDVRRPDLLYESCKGINVKGVDGLWVRLLYTLSWLREIGPMKHRPVPCLGKPVCARSTRAGTFFSGRHFSKRQSRNNFQASKADHFVPASSGHLKCDRVYSAG